jgi:hypothetical protein
MIKVKKVKGKDIPVLFKDHAKKAYWDRCIAPLLL